MKLSIFNLCILIALGVMVMSCKGPVTDEIVQSGDSVSPLPPPTTQASFKPIEINAAVDTLFNFLKDEGLIKGEYYYNELVISESMPDVGVSVGDTSFVAVLVQSGDGELIQAPGFSYETYEILYSYLVILRVHSGTRTLLEVFPLPECQSSMGELRYLEANNLMLAPDHFVVSIAFSRNDVHDDSKSSSSEVSLYALQNRHLVKIFHFLSMIEEVAEVEGVPSPYSFTRIELSEIPQNGLYDITLIETSSDGSSDSGEQVERFSYFWNGSEYVDL